MQSEGLIKCNKKQVKLKENMKNKVIQNDVTTKSERR